MNIDSTLKNVCVLIINCSTFYCVLENKFDSETKKSLEVSSDVPMIIPSDNPIDNLDGKNNKYYTYLSIPSTYILLIFI